MLALGTQFLRLPDEPNPDEPIQAHGAEFYASACHQALHLGAYLNRTSVPTLQAMVFMTYFLSNANRSSDAWAFAGIVIRQAYAIGLNRNPALLSRPRGTTLEQQERRRLWQGVVAQDASMSVVLKLPPGAVYADIDLSAPLLGATAEPVPLDIPYDPMRPSSFDTIDDVEYSRGMYSLGMLVQQSVAVPRSLSQPFATTAKQRSQLVARFDLCRKSWAETFWAWDDQTLIDLATNDPTGRRLVRQIFFLTSHYWHAVMLIHAEGCDLPGGSKKDQEEITESVKGALQAAHELMRAFFVLPILLEGEAGTWWTKAHRAFSAAVSGS